MKIRMVHVGLGLAAMATLAIVISVRIKQETVDRELAAAPARAPAVAAPAPSPTLASTPEARAYQARLAFENETRAFLRDAPTLDDRTRMRRAQALSREIDQREQAREMSADEAMMLRIGLIHAAVKDDMQRVAQSQEVVDRYRKRTAERQAAFLAKQKQDAHFQAYKAAEARIVSEVLAMQSYPGGLSRDDYLRLRLQEARETIYNTPVTPGTPAPTP
jgi:hypothetical protein